MLLTSKLNESRLPSGYGRHGSLPDPDLPLPSITLGQVVRDGELDQKAAYEAMKGGRVPESIQSRYSGWEVKPGQRKDFQTERKTAYELYLDDKIPEYEALNAIYNGKVPASLQDRFPGIEVVPGSEEEDPSYRFWNAFGLGSLANPKENLAKKIGLMTLGGGSLNVVGKPVEVLGGEILHAADPSSDPRDFTGRLMHTGETEKTVGENFFHNTMIGSRLDPDKYAADADKYDHNVVTQAGAGLLRLVGLDGLQEAVNDDTDRTGLYRGLKGTFSVANAASQLTPLSEGMGGTLSQLGKVGRGIGRGFGKAGRGASAVGRGIGRGFGKAGRGASAVGRGIGRGVSRVSKPALSTGQVSRLGDEAIPRYETPAMGDNSSPLLPAGDEAAKPVPSPVPDPVRADPYRLPAPAKPAAVDPVTLLDRDPATLSGAEQDALFDFRRSQRKVLGTLDPQSGPVMLREGGAGAPVEALPRSGDQAADAFNRSVTNAFKTSARRLSDQALFADSKDILGRAQRAEALADETLARMRQTSLEAGQLVESAKGRLQDAPAFAPSRAALASLPERSPFRRGSTLRRPVKPKGGALAPDDLSDAFEQLYGPSDLPSLPERSPFRRGSTLRRPVKPKGGALVPDDLSDALEQLYGLSETPVPGETARAFSRTDPLRQGGHFRRIGADVVEPAPALNDEDWVVMNSRGTQTGPRPPVNRDMPSHFMSKGQKRPLGPSEPPVSRGTAMDPVVSRGTMTERGAASGRADGLRGLRMNTLPLYEPSRLPSGAPRATTGTMTLPDPLLSEGTQTDLAGGVAPLDRDISQPEYLLPGDGITPVAETADKATAISDPTVPIEPHMWDWTPEEQDAYAEMVKQQRAAPPVVHQGEKPLGYWDEEFENHLTGWQKMRKHMEEYGTMDDFADWSGRTGMQANPDAYDFYLRSEAPAVRNAYNHAYGGKLYDYFAPPGKRINTSPIQVDARERALLADRARQQAQAAGSSEAVVERRPILEMTEDEMLDYLKGQGRHAAEKMRTISKLMGWGGT